MFWRSSIVGICFGLLATIFLVSTLHTQQKRCSDEESRRALNWALKADTPRSWDVLYKSYSTFGNCDDGAVGEAFSEAVARILVDHWNTLSRFANIASKDDTFRAFVIKHLDATLNMDDVQKIKKAALTHCPSGLRNFECRYIEN